jgi:hypothetical protein
MTTPPVIDPLRLRPGVRIVCAAWWRRAGMTEGRVVSVQGDGSIEVNDGGPQTHYVTGEMVVEVLEGLK